MRFAAALSAVQELDPLYEAGCDEVYLGLLEESWRRTYGGHDIISRRQGKANLAGRSELRQVLSRAKTLRVPVYLTLNARYTPEQYPYLLKLCATFSDWGGTGVIVQDIRLLQQIKERGLPLRLTASLLMVTVNAQQVRFLKELGADRVVLPRFLRTAEMKKIASMQPEMEYEVMVMGDKCPMIDGLCRSFHGETFSPVIGEKIPADAATACLRTFDTACEAHHLCGGMQRESDPCAACELQGFEEAGICVMKFGGRGTPLEMRIRDLRFFARAKSCPDPEKIQQMYREVYRHACHCYYS